MQYSFVFATVAQYQAAKAEGAAIHAAVNDSTYLSVSAVSFIRELGRSVIDAKNVIVPREQGQLGDVLLYHTSTSTFYWLKSNNTSWSASSLGQTIATASISGFVKVGYMVRKRGRDCIILGMNDDSSGAGWADEGTSTATGYVPGMAYGTVQLGDRATAFYGGAYTTRYVESRFPSSLNQYSLPINRAAWDAAVAAEKEAARTGTAGATGSGTVGTYFGYSWEVVAVTENSGTVYLARITVNFYSSSSVASPKTFYARDYGYSFDRFYRMNISVWPMVRIMTDNNGIQNTGILVRTGNSPAANLCAAHAVAVTGFEAGKWWMPELPLGVDILENAKTLNDRGAGLGTGSYWTSSQYNTTHAWYVNLLSAMVSNYAKANSNRVRAVAGFHI